MASVVSVVLSHDEPDHPRKKKDDATKVWGAYNDGAWFIIQPMACWKAGFDGCTALLLLVLAFYIPFSIAFLDVEDYIWFDWYQLAWFSIDIVLSFCSPFESEEGWVTNPRWIAYEYCQCYFWIDFLSTFPFVLTLGASSGASPLTKLLKMPRLIKTLRVLKVTKLTRAYKLDDVLSQVTAHLMIPPNAATLVILFLCALVVNHCFACMWYSLGAKEYSEECQINAARDCTWMQVQRYGAHRS